MKTAKRFVPYILIFLLMASVFSPLSPLRFFVPGSGLGAQDESLAFD